ncbi:MAG: hypothetical protein JNG84_08450 [Archangium sp.]|nr:hypothetical protein [Archangium sp.]
MRFHRAVVVLALAVVSQGCAGCIGKEFTISRTFNVHAESTDPLCSTDRQEINLGNDLNDVKGFISKVELRKIKVQVTNPKTRDDSVATKGNGTVFIASSATEPGTELSTYGDVDIVAGSERDIEINAATAATLSTLALNDPNTFFVESRGCSDANPAFYEFKVYLTLYAGF